MLQQIVGRAALRHGLELVHKDERVQYHDQREVDPGTSHLDQNGVPQVSQVMVQQLVEKGMLKGNIPKLDNFNGDPQTTKYFFLCLGETSHGPERGLYTCLYQDCH